MRPNKAFPKQLLKTVDGPTKEIQKWKEISADKVINDAQSLV